METHVNALGGGPVEAAPGSLQAQACADYLVRVADGSNLWNSRKFNVWGCDSMISTAKGFLERVRPGDRLWFVQNKSQGRLVGVATFKYKSARVLGPLVSVLTDEELGWTGGGTWDTLIHYTDFYDLRDCKDLYSHLKGQSAFQRYSPKNCKEDLPQIYPSIIRFGGAKKLD